MKIKLLKLLLALFLTFGTIHIIAQEKKNQMVISGILVHYDEIIKNDHQKAIDDYYLYPVDPGFELLFKRNLANNFSFGTGLCFQNGKISTVGQHRFHFSEISIPIQIFKEFVLDPINGLCVTTGLYGGKMLLTKAEGADSHENWYEISEFDKTPYSNDALFLDLYLGIGYIYTLSKKSHLSLIPFGKYRIEPDWFNYFQEKFHYGIKLSYTFSL